MKQKLLFFDIDGTLLSEKTHTIPLSTIKALKQVKENGHLVFINTGRPRSTIDQCVHDLKPDGYICGCGTYVSYHDQLLYHYQVSPEIVKKLLKLCDQYQIQAIFEASDKVYFPRNCIDTTLQLFRDNYQSNNFPLGTLDDEDVHTDKFCIQFYQDVSAFYQAIQNDFEIIERKKGFSEIVPKNHSKASGIQCLVDYFQTSLDNCYVFGDSFNDESMLSYVQHSIVMKNGDQELFKIAEYVTDELENDGIAKALKHYQLI